MKIKIESRWANIPMTDKDELVYDVYHGFGRPIFFPIFTKWMLDKAGLSEHELHDYLYPYIASISPIKCEKIILNL